MWASSWAMTASSSSRRATRSSPVETTSVAPPGPRPTTNARGKPSSIRQSFGGCDLELRGETVGRRAQQRILGERERPRVEHPEQRPVTEPVDGDRGASAQNANSAALRCPPISQPRPPARATRKRDQERAP